MNETINTNTILKFIHSFYKPTLEKRIEALPEEIKQFIYWEYFDTEIQFKIFKTLLETESTQRLSISDIRPYLPIVLAKPKVVEYLRSRIHSHGFMTFDVVYKEYKMKPRDKKVWTGANNGDAFC